MSAEPQFSCTYSCKELKDNYHFLHYFFSSVWCGGNLLQTWVMGFKEKYFSLSKFPLLISVLVRELLVSWVAIVCPALWHQLHTEELSCEEKNQLPNHVFGKGGERHCGGQLKAALRAHQKTSFPKSLNGCLCLHTEGSGGRCAEDKQLLQSDTLKTIPEQSFYVLICCPI